MFHLGAQETAQAKDDRRDKRSQRAQAQWPPGKEVGSRAGQPDVQDDAPGYLLGCGQPQQRPVKGVEDRYLRVGQQRSAHEKVGIPQGQPSRAQRFAGQVAVWIKVGEHVEAGQHTVGEGDSVEEEEGQGPQCHQGQGVGPREPAICTLPWFATRRQASMLCFSHSSHSRWYNQPDSRSRV